MIRKVLSYQKYIEHDEHWNIAIRKKRQKEEFFWDIETPNFTEMPLNKNYWCADPFLFKFKEKTFLFFELYDLKAEKGKIAYCEIYDNQFGEVKVVIDKPYHMSFPYLFENDGNIYMMPECHESGKLIVFKCINFPDVWEEYTVLIDSFKANDSIILKSKNYYWLLTSVMANDACTLNNQIFKLDLDKLKIESPPINLGTGSYGYRNAGNLIVSPSHDGQLRVAQDCSNNDYGKGIVVFETLITDDGLLKEKEIKYIDSKTIHMNGKTFSGIHTYNSTDDYEVIDLKTLHKNGLYKKMKLFSMMTKRYIMRRMNHGKPEIIK